MTIRDIVVDLSDEQVRIMQRIACGDTYTEIGKEIHVSNKTVQNRVRDVCNAIGCDHGGRVSRVEALVLLLQEGIVK